MAYRFTFRPWASVATVLALVILVGLGAWQLERRQWKAGLIADIDARLTAAEVEMPARLDDPKAWEWRRVQVTGAFVAADDLRWLNRTLDGAPGWHAITALTRTDGPPLLVDRGWLAAATATAPPAPDGTITITGVLRPAPGQGWFQPANDASSNAWFWLAPGSMATALGLEAAPAPLVLTADPPLGEGLRRDSVRPDLRDNHLDYALTWFSLAVILTAVFLISSRRRG